MLPEGRRTVGRGGVCVLDTRDRVDSVVALYTPSPSVHPLPVVSYGGTPSRSCSTLTCIKDTEEWELRGYRSDPGACGRGNGGMGVYLPIGVYGSIDVLYPLPPPGTPSPPGTVGPYGGPATAGSSCTMEVSGRRREYHGTHRPGGRCGVQGGGDTRTP